MPPLDDEQSLWIGVGPRSCSSRKLAYPLTDLPAIPPGQQFARGRDALDVNLAAIGYKLSLCPIGRGLCPTAELLSGALRRMSISLGTNRDLCPNRRHKPANRSFLPG